MTDHTPRPSETPETPDLADDPLGPARPVTQPASVRTSPSRAAGGRRRRAHPAKWGRRVAAGGASLAVVALTLHLAGGATATVDQASGATASDTTSHAAARDDDHESDDHDDEYDDEYSAARSTASSSSTSASSRSANGSSTPVSTSRGS